MPCPIDPLLPNSRHQAMKAILSIQNVSPAPKTPIQTTRWITTIISVLSRGVRAVITVTILGRMKNAVGVEQYSEKSKKLQVLNTVGK